jgi:hypothetical protein
MFGKDRRSERRIVSDIRASIIGARPKRFPCAIKNVSARGAKIWFGAEWVLPARFELVGSRDERDTLSCRLVWRRGDHAGVKFIQRLE